MPRVKGMNYTKDERRELILQAGLVTFCRMGYDGTNIDDIARESKCSHGLIYYYFKNKEEIFRELVKISATSAEKAGFFSSQQADASPRERLRDMAVRTLSMICENENFFYYFQFTTMLKLLKKDLSYLGIEPPKYLPYDSIRSILADGQAEGVFREGDTDAYANLYIAILQGLANRKAMTDGADHPPFVMPTVDMIMNIFVK